MKTIRPYPRAVITPKGERAAANGHPWVYEAEVERLESPEGEPLAAPPEDGSIVDVLTGKGRYIGSGFYNHNSKIRVRLISRSANDRFDEGFWERKLRYAWDYRKTVMGADGTQNCRVIFGEADGFPGLTVDKFGEILVSQTLCLGTELRKDLIFPALVQAMEEDGETIRGVYERSDAKVRRQEGMELCKGFIGEPFDTDVEIEENGVRYLVDVKDGQKTGFFLDQKYNRLAIQKLCPGAKVLDCFTHTGSFALNAAKGGASSVLGVDASELGVRQAEKNAALNRVTDRVKFLCADVFELLPELEAKGEKYDVIILDPPAFTKSRNSVKNAVKGYREINIRGMKLVRDGGYLATCSCSHFMDPELFVKTLREAAAGAHKRLRQVEYRTQAADHPILWAADASYYLKFYIFQVCEEK